MIIGIVQKIKINIWFFQPTALLKTRECEHHFKLEIQIVKIYDHFPQIHIRKL